MSSSPGRKDKSRRKAPAGEVRLPAQTARAGASPASPLRLKATAQFSASQPLPSSSSRNMTSSPTTRGSPVDLFSTTGPIGSADATATRYFAPQEGESKGRGGISLSLRQSGIMRGGGGAFLPPTTAAASGLDGGPSMAKSYLHESTLEGTSLKDALHYLFLADEEGRKEKARKARILEKGGRVSADRFEELERKKRSLCMAPRHHHARYRRSCLRADYYDLVVVLNANKRKLSDLRDQAAAGDSVPEDAMVNVSLRGVLNPQDDELLDLPAFMREKSQRDELVRTTKFFGSFWELKCFTKWRHATWRARFLRRQRRLARAHWLTDAPVAALMHTLRTIVVTAQAKARLYEFNQASGVWGAQDFMEAQKMRIRRMGTFLAGEVDKMAEVTVGALDGILNTQYTFGTSVDRPFNLMVADEAPSQLTITRLLADRTRDWRDPGAGEELATVVDRRGANDVRQELTDKVRRVVRVAHMMVQHAVGVNMAYFFDMFQQSITGVRRVNTNVLEGAVGSWVLGKAQQQNDIVTELVEADRRARGDWDEEDELERQKAAEVAETATTVPFAGPIGGDDEANASASAVAVTDGRQHVDSGSAAVDEEDDDDYDEEDFDDNDDDDLDQGSESLDMMGEGGGLSPQEQRRLNPLSAPVAQAYLMEGFHLGIEAVMNVGHDPLPVRFDMSLHRMKYPDPNHFKELRARLKPALPTFIAAQQDVFMSLAELISQIPALPMHPLLVSHADTEERKVAATWQARMDASTVADRLDQGLEPREEETGSERLHRLLSDESIRNGFLLPPSPYVDTSVTLQGIRARLDKCQSDLRVAYSGVAVSAAMKLADIQSAFRAAYCINIDGYLTAMVNRPTHSMLHEVMEEGSVDGFVNATAEELTRTSVFIGKVVFLQNLIGFQESFPIIKADPGLVVSFGPAVVQLDSLLRSQAVNMFASVPMTLANMCTKFEKLAFFIADAFEVKGVMASRRKDVANELPYETLTHLMKLLFAYESGRSVMDAEQVAINSIYRVFQQYYKGEQVEKNYLTESAAGAERRIANVLAGAAHPDHMLRRFDKASEKLSGRLLQCNIFLSKGIPGLRKETIARKAQLDADVTAMHEDLMDPRFLDTDANAAEICSVLRETRMPLASLRDRRSKLVAIMLHLVDLTDYVDSLEMPLYPHEMDQIPMLDEVGTLHEQLLDAWTSVISISRIMTGMMESTLAKCDVTQLNKQLGKLREAHDALLEQIGDKGPVVVLRDALRDVAPKLSVVNFLKAASLSERHWQRITQLALVPVGLAVKWKKGEAVLYESFGSEGQPIAGGARPLGAIAHVPLYTLLSRGLGKRMDTIGRITTDAVIESVAQEILASTRKALDKARLDMGVGWLRDLQVRNAVGREVRQLLNAQPLLKLVEEGGRAMTIVEQCMRDMLIDSLRTHTDSITEDLGRIRTMLLEMVEAQSMWRDVLDHVLFAQDGEYEKDAEFVFGTATQTLHLLDRTVSSALGSAIGTERTMTQDNMSLEKVRHDLRQLKDSVHSNVDSMLLACPRLSLLPYSKLRAAMRMWHLGITGNSPEWLFMTSCVQDLFDGVGTLVARLDEDSSEMGVVVCAGFVSADGAETVHFASPISVRKSLATFVNKFDTELKAALTRSCDVFAVARLVGLRSLVSDMLLSNIGNPESMKVIFEQRIRRLQHLAHDGHPNQSYTLFNHVCFSEDVAVALGRPSGAMHRLRPDADAFSNLVMRRQVAAQWRTNLSILLEVMNASITELQGAQQLTCIIGTSQDNFKGGGISSAQRSGDISRVKTTALVASLLRQESTWVNVVRRVLDAPSLESAYEVWEGVYKIQFIYGQRGRKGRGSAMEVNIGGCQVGYGMEYYGGKPAVLDSIYLDRALRCTIAAGARGRGAVLVSQENCSSHLQSKGDYSVRAADLAMALGRIFTSLTNVQPENTRSVHMFLGRLVYLRAVGCVDFVGMSSPAMDSFCVALEEMASALKCGDDFYVQEALHYPFPVMRPKGAIALERRKHNAALLEKILHYADSSNNDVKAFDEPRMLLVGVASETNMGEPRVFHHLCRSLFDPVSVANIRPTDDLGLLLSVKGFTFGSCLQQMTNELLSALHERLGVNVPMNSTQLITTAMWRRLSQKVESCFAFEDTMAREEGRHIAAGVTPGRFLREMDTFFACLWEDIMLAGDYASAEPSELRAMVVRTVQPMIDEVLSPVKTGPSMLLEGITLPKMNPRDLGKNLPTLDLSRNMGRDSLCVPTHARTAVYRAASKLGYRLTGDFLRDTISTWDALSRADTTVVVISGSVAAGKTAVRRTALMGMAQSGILMDAVHGGSVALCRSRGAFLIKRFVARWRAKRESAALEVATAAALEKGGVPPLVGGSVSAVLNAGESITRERGGMEVKVTVIHPRALTIGQLLGSVDDDGHWRDGVLVTKLRGGTVDSKATMDTSNIVFSSQVQTVVLDGPLDHCIEQLFCSSWMYTSQPSSYDDSCRRRLVFPSGELGVLRPAVKVIMETADSSSASPAFLARVHMVHVSTSPRLAARRAVASWVTRLTAWLDVFPPWQDQLVVVRQVVLKDDLFYMKLMDIDRQEVKGNLSLGSILCRLSSFLHLLETLLNDCHTLALRDAAVAARSDEMDNRRVCCAKDARDTGGKFKLKLGILERAQLAKRVRLSVMYAALWGFGSTYHGTAKSRKFLDILTATLDGFFHDEWSLEVDDLRDPFEAKLDLKGAQLVTALRLSEREGDAEVYGDDHSPVTVMPRQADGHMIFNTTLSEALRLTSLHLLSSGARLAISGVPGVGKSMLLHTIMSTLGEGVPNPQNTRDYARANLPGLLDKERKTDVQGMPAILLGLAKRMAGVRRETEEGFLGEATSILAPKVDLLGLPVATTVNIREHRRAKTFYTISTSLHATTSSNALHAWLTRELATASPNVLSAPVNSLGTIFIDDLHVPAEAHKSEKHAQKHNKTDQAAAESARIMHGVHDDPVALIKGLADVIHLSGLGRMSKKSEADLSNPSFPIAPSPRPLLQRIAGVGPDVCSDNTYLLDPVAMVATMNISLDGMLTQADGKLAQLVPRFSILHMPAMNIGTLHAALVAGIHSVLHVNVREAVHGQLVELTKYLTEIDSSARSAEDKLLTVPMERSLRSFVALDVARASRFCQTFTLAHRTIGNSEELLRCCVHEWRRLFIDPLPLGYQRERYCALMSMKFAKLSPNKWDIDRDVLDFLFRELNDDDVEPRGLWFPVTANVLGAREIVARRGEAIRAGVSALEDDDLPDASDEIVMANLLAMSETADADADAGADAASADTVAIYRPVVLSDSKDRHKYYTAEDRQRFSEGRTVEHLPSFQELTVDASAIWGLGGPPVVPAPTLLNRLLRLSRSMASGRPMLIATYAGVEAASAAGIAAQLSGYVPIRFNCWNRLGEPNVAGTSDKMGLGLAGGAAPSEASMLALDARYFLKRAILRAAGLKESYIDVPPSQAYRIREATIFVECDAVKTVAILAGLQELPSAHRSDVLRFMESGDPACLFMDYELIAIDFCLYDMQVKRERSAELHETQEAVSASVHLAHVLSTNTSPIPSYAASRAGSVDASAYASVVLNDDVSDAQSAAEGPLTLGMSTMSVAGMADGLDVDGTAPILGALDVSGAPPPVGPGPLGSLEMLSSVLQPPGNDEEEEEEEEKEDVSPPPAGSRRAAAKPDGRALGSVRSYLKQKCDANLRMVFTTDYPRPLKLDPIDESAYDSREALKHLKQSGAKVDASSVMAMQSGGNVVRKTTMSSSSAGTTAGRGGGGGDDGGVQRRSNLVNKSVQEQRGENNDVYRTEAVTTEAATAAAAAAATVPSSVSESDEFESQGPKDLVAGANDLNYAKSKLRQRSASISMLLTGASAPRGMTEKQRALHIEQTKHLQPGENVADLDAARAAKSKVEDEDWYVDLMATEEMLTAPDVLLCPILGPMLRKHFDCIWFADGEGAATEKICQAYLEEKPVHLDEDGQVDVANGGLNMDYRCNFGLVVPSVTLMGADDTREAAVETDVDGSDDDASQVSNPWGGDNPFDNRPLTEQTLPSYKLTLDSTGPPNGGGGYSSAAAVAREKAEREAEGASKEVDISIQHRPSVGAARSLHALPMFGAFSSARKDMLPSAAPPPTEEDEDKEEVAAAATAAPGEGCAADGAPAQADGEVAVVGTAADDDTAPTTTPTTTTSTAAAATDGGGGGEATAATDGDKNEVTGEVEAAEAEAAATAAASEPPAPLVTAEFRSVSVAVEDEFLKADFAEREIIMRSEAMEILPALLTVATPSDACLLNQPIVMMGPEEVAHRAARLVCLAIHEAVESLERRRIQLRIAKRELERAADLVTRIAELSAGCEERALLLDTEASAAQVVVHKLVVQCDEVAVWAMGTPDAETQQMMREDQSATRRERCDPAAYDDRLEELAHEIKLLDHKHLVSLGSVFQVQIDDPALLTLVRAVVALIDFKPKKKAAKIGRHKSVLKGVKGSKKGSGRGKSQIAGKVGKAGKAGGSEKDGDATAAANETRASEDDRAAAEEHISDADICKYALALFNSRDLLTKVCGMDATRVGRGQRSKEVVRQCTALMVLDPGSSSLVSSNQDVVELVRTLTSYAQAFMGRMNFLEVQSLLFSDLQDMHDVRDELRLRVNKTRKVQGGLLEEDKSAAIKHLQMKEKYAALCRSKGALLAQLQGTHSDLRPQLEASLTFVEKEFVDSVSQRKHIVGDICVGAALLHRAGWLPEHVRAEVLESLRALMDKSKVPVSADPFSLGCLVDRRQIRRWTQGLNRDIATINTLSLVHYNSDYAYVVDPDGCAVKPLLASCPDDYTPMCIKAHAFSFDLLRDQVNEVRTSGRRGVYLVLTDAQTGVSADLVTLLFSELHTTHHGVTKKHHNRGPVEMGMESDSDAEEEEEEAYHAQSELYASVTGLGPNDCLASEYGRVPLVPMRLLIVGTVPPTIDAGGRGYPLPPSAFRRVTIIQWMSGASGSSYVEAKPMQACNNKTFVPDGLLEESLTETLLHKLSPNHVGELVDINKSILEHQDVMYDVENRIVRMLWIMYCSKRTKEHIGGGGEAASAGERDAVSLGLATPAQEDMEKVDLGLLIDGNSLHCLHVNKRERTHMAQRMDNLQQQERDLLAYQTVVRELLFMSSRYCRMCAYMIPTTLLAPYALSGRALALKAVAPTLVAHARDFCGFPTSLHKLRIFSRCIRKIQINFRNWFRSRHEADDHWTHKEGDTLTGLEMGGSLEEGLDGGTEADRVERRRRMSAKKAKQRVHKLGNKMDSLMTLRHKERTQCMADMAYLTRDLRKLLLKGIVEYVRVSIRPGFEWLVKFALLVTTWGTSSRPIPNDDLRLVVHNVLGSMDLPHPRYAHDVSLQFSEEGNRPDARFSLKGDKVTLGGGRRMSVHKERKRGSFLETKHTHDPVTSSLGRSQGTTTKNSGAEELESLSRQHTEIKQQRRASRMSQVHSEKALDRASADAAGQRQLERTGLPEVWEEGTWRQRGTGVIDGLWICESSTRWKIAARERGCLNSVRGSFVGPGGGPGPPKALVFEWNCTYVDVPGAANITAKSTLFRPTPRGPDVFELEWLQCHGVKVFSLLPLFAEEASASYVVQMPRTRNTVRRTIHATANEDMGALDVAIPNARESRKSIATLSMRKSTAVMRKKETMNDGTSACSLKDQMAAFRVATAESDNVKRKDDTAAMTASKVIGLGRNIGPGGGGMGGSTGAKVSGFSGAGLEEDKHRSQKGHSRKQSMTTSLMMKQREGGGMEVLQSSMDDLSTAAATDDNDDNDDGKDVAPAGFELMGMTLVVDTDMRAHEEMLAKSRKLMAAATTLAMKVKFQKLFGNPKVQHFLNTMELHSASEPVFGGISNGITQTMRAFELWRSSLEGLRGTRFNDKFDRQLGKLLERITPPTLEYDWDDDDPDPTAGLWVQGKELTVIQTLQLAGVLAPNSIAGLVELYGAAMAVFIHRGGTVTLHQGEELQVAYEEGSEAGADNLDDIAEESEGSEESSADEDEDEDEFEGDSGGSNLGGDGGLTAPRAAELGVCQDTEQFNAWTALKRMITGQDGVQKVVSTYHKQYGYSKSVLTPRDYDDWEGALLELLSVDSSAGRPLCLSEITAAISHGHVRVLLTPNVPGLEVSTSGWSRSAESIALLMNKTLTYVKFPRQTMPIRPSITEDAAVRRAYALTTRVETRPVHNIVRAIATSTDTPAATPNHKKRLRPGAKSGVAHEARSTFTELVDLEQHAAMPYMDALHDGLTAVALLRAATQRENNRLMYLHRRKSAYKLSPARGMGPAAAAVTADGAPMTPTPVPEPQAAPTSVARRIGGHVMLSQMPVQSDEHPTLTAHLPAHSADLPFVWLPRFSGTDLVTTSKMPTTLIDVSIPEATDTLMLEMEQALLWVKQTARHMNAQGSPLVHGIEFTAAGTATKSSHEQLLRVVAFLLVIWKMQTCLNSMERDRSGLAGLWSLCTVPLDYWEVGRLTARVVAVLGGNWSEMLGEYRREHKDYEPAATYAVGDGEGDPHTLNMLVEQPDFVHMVERITEVFVDPGTSADYPEVSGRQLLIKRLQRRQSNAKPGQVRIGVTSLRQMFIKGKPLPPGLGQQDSSTASTASLVSGGAFSPTKPPSGSPLKSGTGAVSPIQTARRLSMSVGGGGGRGATLVRSPDARSHATGSPMRDPHHPPAPRRMSIAMKLGVAPATATATATDTELPTLTTTTTAAATSATGGIATGDGASLSTVDAVDASTLLGVTAGEGEESALMLSPAPIRPTTGTASDTGRSYVSGAQSTKSGGRSAKHRKGGKNAPGSSSSTAVTPTAAKTGSAQRRRSKMIYEKKLAAELRFAADQRRLSTQLMQNARLYELESQPPGRALLGSVGYFLAKVALSDRLRATRSVVGGLGAMGVHDVVASSDKRRHTVVGASAAAPKPAASAAQQGTGAAALFAMEAQLAAPHARVVNVLPHVDLSLGCMRAVDVAGVATKWLFNK